MQSVVGLLGRGLRTGDDVVLAGAGLDLEEGWASDGIKPRAR